MTSLDIDVLSVRKIYAKGNNQFLPANTVLTTDGLGGTFWTSLSSIASGTSFNAIITTGSTFTSSPGNTKFSILDGSNIGLIPSNTGASATLYSKSFGEINVSGQNSIYSFNTLSGTFNNAVNLIGTGALTISTNTATNRVFFNSPNDAISSLSSLITNMTNLNSGITTAINSFNSPFSTFIYTSLSSFSTSLGPTITTRTFASTLSTNTSVSFFTNNLKTSTLTISGSRQPFIQYGSGILTNGISVVTLNTSYNNALYIIQLTYASGSSVYTIPLSFSGVTTNNFVVFGDSNAIFHWTTFGNLF